jgi:hypothetical protein
MLMMLQADTPPPLPWWVMYVALLALAYGTFRLTKIRWWGGCFSALVSWVALLLVAALTIPGQKVGLIVLLPFIPFVACIAALVHHHGGARPAAAAIAADLPGRAWKQFPPGVMQGQPNPRAVLRSKVMQDRVASGMPSDAAFIARLRYVSGAGAMTERPVDLFSGDDRLWVAPLTADPPPFPIPLRDVLRVDVWPELEGPPTLRVNWSPPSSDGTVDLVLATMGSVPDGLIKPQLDAVAGVLTGLMRGAGKPEEQQAPAAPEAASPEAASPGPFARHETPSQCPRCGSPVPAGAPVCPRCMLPL